VVEEDFPFFNWNPALPFRELGRSRFYSATVDWETIKRLDGPLPRFGEVSIPHVLKTIFSNSSVLDFFYRIGALMGVRIH